MYGENIYLAAAEVLLCKYADHVLLFTVQRDKYVDRVLQFAPPNG